MEQGEIILYQPDEAVRLEVRLEDETVWLTQAQIVDLFQSSKANISEHIKNIYDQKELEESSTVRDFRTVRQEGKRQVMRNLTYYNLDAIISIGFRVNSKRGILFRQWANKVLKDYLLKGYSINKRLSELERTVAQHTEKIDFFVRTALPPVEGIFYNGQIFDAYKFATDLVKSARRSIVLIDNRTYRDSHDRFLIVDETDVYHIGASLKDLGKKMFAFSKLDIPAAVITDLL